VLAGGKLGLPPLALAQFNGLLTRCRADGAWPQWYGSRPLRRQFGKVWVDSFRDGGFSPSLPL